jgi:hypothetical protein
VYLVVADSLAVTAPAPGEMACPTEQEGNLTQFQFTAPDAGGQPATLVDPTGIYVDADAGQFLPVASGTLTLTTYSAASATGRFDVSIQLRDGGLVPMQGTFEAPGCEGGDCYSECELVGC